MLHLADKHILLVLDNIDIPESLEQRTGLIPEYDNLQPTLVWFDTRDEVEELQRLTATLAGEWLARGLLRDGLERIERVLGPTRGTASARVQLLNAAGAMALYQGTTAAPRPTSRRA